MGNTSIPSLTINLSRLTSMKVVVILSCLVILSMASPQLQRKVKNRIRNQVTNQKCGDGIDATCVCPDGSQPLRGRFPCNGAGNPTCSCDDGSASTVVTRKKVRDQVRNFFRVDLGHWIDSNTTW